MKKRIVFLMIIGLWVMIGNCASITLSNATLTGITPGTVPLATNATYASYATNAANADWATNISSAGIVGAVAEATHSTNADLATLATVATGATNDDAGNKISTSYLLLTASSNYLSGDLGIGGTVTILGGDGMTTVSNLTVEGHASVAGVQTNTGVLYAEGGVVGDVTGDLTGNADTATAIPATGTVNGVVVTNLISGSTLTLADFTSTVCGYLKFTNAGVVYSIAVSTNAP